MSDDLARIGIVQAPSSGALLRAKVSRRRRLSCVAERSHNPIMNRSVSVRSGHHVRRLVGLALMHTRDERLHCALQPQLRPIREPVEVLVDELSMSASEILAGGLKDLKRARIFGVRTPGAVLPSTIDVLPNGYRFQHATASYVSASGRELEGAGVVPDVETPLTCAAVLETRDPALDAAVCWIRSLKKRP